MSKAKYGAAAIVTMAALATPFIVSKEGNKLKPYLDVGGVPTVCAGVIRGVEWRLYSEDECKSLNAREIAEHAQGLAKCVKAELTVEEWTALLSLTYNVGTGAICSSTLVRQINIGDRRASCDQYLRWSKVNGREVQGLVNRRNAERALCLKGQE